MTETKEIVLLLKELVSRIIDLEKVAYNNDNLLMKSGLVVVDSPTPKMQNKVGGIDLDEITKMSFDDMADIISKME